MKATYVGLTSSVPFASLKGKLYNCARKPYEIPFYIPVTSSFDIQLYIPFAVLKPISFVSTLINLCDDTTVVSPPCHYVFGITSTGDYYGVLRFAAGIDLPALFVIVIDVTMLDGSVLRYCSEGYQIESCVEVTKVEACFPAFDNSLGYDAADIYYGLSADASETIGDIGLRYQHFVNVRRVRVIEDAPKIIFSSNIRQNFKSVLNRAYELRTELVPSWYKEYLMAIYTRGFIQVKGIIYQVTDLALEGVDDDDYAWKPYAKLKKETRFYFGCDTTPCNSDCCSPCSVSATTETILTPCCSPEADFVEATVETIVLGLQCNDNYSVEYSDTDYHMHPAQTIDVYGVGVSVAWASNDRPNRFNIRDNGSLLVTSGWVGFATYAGPWGASLSTSGTGNLSYTPVGGHIYTLEVEAGPADPETPMTDNFDVTIGCS